MKIIVTTDFSDNSVSGLRMAASLAAVLHAELHFLHVCFFPGKPDEDADTHQSRVKKGLEELDQRLQSFVKPFLKYFDSKDSVSYHVKESFLVESAILRLQKKIKADLICLSTRGAGKMPKLLGTTAGNLITQSAVPVLVVPFDYRIRPLKTMVHFCDLENLSGEIKQLARFNEKPGLKTELVHFAPPSGMEKAQEILHKQVKDGSLNVVVLPLNGKSVSKNMLAYAVKKNPSVVAVFTRERKSFLQRIFHTSRSEELAFHTKTPLLVFHKK